MTTLWAVRSKGDHASLWKMITTLAVGSCLGYTMFLHLKADMWPQNEKIHNSINIRLKKDQNVNTENA